MCEQVWNERVGGREGRRKWMARQREREGGERASEEEGKRCMARQREREGGKGERVSEDRGRRCMARQRERGGEEKEKRERNCIHTFTTFSSVTT